MSGVRALSFGSIAKAYERYRAGYPDEVFHMVRAYAGAPIRTALEIGAGTGKATRMLAGHGVQVTATEPDAAMLAELRKAVPANVTTLQAAFEDLNVGEQTTYGLVFAAAALHWTRAEGRCERLAGLLEPQGVFVSCGGRYLVADPELAAAVREARLPFLAVDGVASPDGTPADAQMQWPGTELQRSGLFVDVQQHVVERRLTFSANEFVGYLSTVSAYLQLSPQVRSQAFEAIADVLPETVEIAADVIVHLARRAPE